MGDIDEIPTRITEDADHEDDTPDWTAFAAFARNLSKNKSSSAGTTSSEPIIPKRGEKDFEPATEQRHVNLQVSRLEASRNALFTAISSGTRNHSSKSHNRAIWDGKIARAYMVDASDPSLAPYEAEEKQKNIQGEQRLASVHGIHFQSTGRYEPSRKRLELLPEETLYLLERGTIECWTSEGRNAVPMSLQHAWSRMINAGDMNPHRYQVYAYLRRLGYTVIRADFPRPTPFSSPLLPSSVNSLLSLSNLSSFLNLVSYVPKKIADFCNTCIYGPTLSALSRLQLVASGQRKSLIGGERWTTFDRLFTSLQFVRSGQNLNVEQKTRKEDPYAEFYHVYKPVTKFKKSDPGEPDFRIGVIECAQTTPLPDMYAFSKVFDDLPREATSLPLPVMSKRSDNTSYLSSMKSKLYSFLYSHQDESSPTAKKPFKDTRPPTQTRPAPYARLKAGNKSAIIAVVDNGTMSFHRFGDSDFAELPWVGDGTGYATPV